MHRALKPPADAALNLASAITLTAFALRTGCTPAELGLDRADLKKGLRTGSIAGACCAAGIGIAAALPSTRKFFLDARLTGMSRKETLYHASLRIPVATALAEEIMFRSVLHALFAQEHSLRTTLTWTSSLFGLWHILPTLDTFEGNPASIIVQDPGRARLMATLGITGTTAGAGLFFSYLRLRSRSVAAAVLTHAVINIVALVIGKALVDRALPHTTPISSRTR
ncbi:MAG: lysostaphin resistance A-like protein [Actinomycetota bacterium]